VGARGVWLTWVFGAVVTRNVVRGPLHYGIDLDAMASFCAITNNDVETSLPGRVALFVEMQCRNNVVSGNRLAVAGGGGGYGLNVNSFLNTFVSNELEGSGVKISGVAPYPTALSNRFVDNVAIGRFSTQHAGCGNYATENAVTPLNVTDGMALEGCAARPGGCGSPLNTSFGCLDPAANLPAMLFSDASPLLPACANLSGRWSVTGHDRLVINVTQSGNRVAWCAAAPGTPFPGPTQGSGYNGTATIWGAAAEGTVHATYKYSKGVHHNTYGVVTTLPAGCNDLQWFRPQSSGLSPFANWTRIDAGREAALQNHGRGEAANWHREAVRRRITALDRERRQLVRLLAAME